VTEGGQAGPPKLNQTAVCECRASYPLLRRPVAQGGVQAFPVVGRLQEVRESVDRVVHDRCSRAAKGRVSAHAKLLAALEAARKAKRQVSASSKYAAHDGGRDPAVARLGTYLKSVYGRGLVTQRENAPLTKWDSVMGSVTVTNVFMVDVEDDVNYPFKNEKTSQQPTPIHPTRLKTRRLR